MADLLRMIPSKYRKIAYAVLAFALAVYGIWQGVEGDWTQFAIALVTALSSTMATVNTETDQE